MAAFALNTQPQKHSYFERKHYFYPDLPMGYQISQLHAPIIVGGFVEIEIDGEKKKINLNRGQLEADAGKNTHPEGADYSLVDLNRVGTPLLEIVSEPEIHSAAEAKAYARELYLLMKYAGVSDVDLYHGNMRFDVNVSVSKDPKNFGKRTETKNLNSFRSVENAVLYEIDRQVALLEKGEEIVQETRGWDEAKQKTVGQRSKEEAQDYRYMPEPDIPPVALSDDYIEKIKRTMPILPSEWRSRLKNLDLNSAILETILENEGTGYVHIGLLDSIINQDKDLAAFIVKFQLNDLPGIADGAGSLKHDLTLDQYTAVHKLVKDGKLNSTKSKELLLKLMDLAQDTDAEEYANKNGYIQVSDESEIEKIVAEVLAENAKAAEDVKNGETKAIGFLVGQVMKKSKGQANPGLAQALIKKQLGL